MPRAFVIQIEPGYAIVPQGSKEYHRIPADLVGNAQPFRDDEVEKGLWCLMYFEGGKPSREVFVVGSAEDSIIESGVYSWVNIEANKVVGRDGFRIREVLQEHGDPSVTIPYEVTSAPVYQPEEGEERDNVLLRYAPIPKVSSRHTRHQMAGHGLDTAILADKDRDRDTSHVPANLREYHATLTKAAQQYAQHNFTVDGSLLNLQRLPQSFCVFQSIPRSGKSIGMLQLLKNAANQPGMTKKIVVATTTRLLAAILYDNLYMMWGCNEERFNNEVLLHMGRGVGSEERTYGAVKTVFDMNTCHEDMIGAVNSVGAQGGNLFAVCGTCPYRGFGNQDDQDDQEMLTGGNEVRGECRYWVTRDRLQSRDFKIAIVTIGSLEYLNIKFDNRTVLILDEMSPNVPTGRISIEDLVKTRNAINKLEQAYRHLSDPDGKSDNEEHISDFEEYRFFPAIASLLNILEGDTDSSAVDVNTLQDEVKVLRKGMKGTGIPSRPLITALGKKFKGIHFGRTQDGEWVFARIPDWSLPVGNNGLQVLYIDATPSPFAEHLVGAKPYYIKRREGKWPVEVIMHQVPISRSMIEGASQVDSPQTRYMRIAQAFGISRNSLWTGIKSAHGDFYIWGSRGRSGGEGHEEVTLLASAYQIPADISVILSHALVGADATAKSTWGQMIVGKYPKRLRHKPSYRQNYSKALYPYPFLVWDGEPKYGIAKELKQTGYPANKHPMSRQGSLYSSSLIVASELLQTIGRAFTPVNFDDNGEEGEVTQGATGEYNRVRVNVIGTVPLYGLVRWVSVQHPEESLPIREYFEKMRRTLWVTQNRETNIERFRPPIQRFFVLKGGSADE